MDKYIQMGYDIVMYIFYDSKLNIFYDDEGNEMHYLFEMLTPNDIMLFKADYGYNFFVNRTNRSHMIEILVDY